MPKVSLNASIRRSMQSLKQSSTLFDQTTNRLATGKKVSSAIDNPTNFFASVNLNDRAEGLSSRLDSMGQSVQRIQAADNGISTIRSFTSALKGIVNNALGNIDSDSRDDLGKQFNGLIAQIGTAAADSSYQGINLLQDSGGTGESETVQFNETFDQSTLQIKGFNIQTGNFNSATGTISGVGAQDLTGIIGLQRTFTGAAPGIVTGPLGGALVIATQDSAIGLAVDAHSSIAAPGSISWTNNATYQENLSLIVTQLEAFDNELKSQASALANNLSTITIREEFSTNMINTLNSGSDKLVLADLNEEGAHLLALQTSSQLASQSLALASQQSQQVLQLLG